MWRFREHSSWNEYRWEQEIRRDERRISRYFCELATCIDLPGEEDMIFSQLSSQSDLVPAGGPLQDLRSWSYIDQSDEDEDQEDQEYSRSGKFEHLTVQMIDQLATAWNILSSGMFHGAPFEFSALGITCAYAKLTARSADFADIDLSETPQFRALKITLGKRCLADLNILVNAMRIFSEKAPGRSQIEEQIEKLSWVRNRLTHALMETERS